MATTDPETATASGGPDEAPYLLCFDDSECAANAIREAGAITGGGPAIVAHVWFPPSSLMFQGRRLDEGHPLAPAAREFDAAAREHASRALAAGVAVAREAGFEPEPLLVEGDHGVWRPLVELADARRARAVVAGSRGLSPVRSTLMGDVSRGIANHCRRPVIIVPLPPNLE